MHLTLHHSESSLLKSLLAAACLVDSSHDSTAMITWKQEPRNDVDTESCTSVHPHSSTSTCTSAYRELSVCVCVLITRYRLSQARKKMLCISCTCLQCTFNKWKHLLPYAPPKSSKGLLKTCADSPDLELKEVASCFEVMKLTAPVFVNKHQLRVA